MNRTTTDKTSRPRGPGDYCCGAPVGVLDGEPIDHPNGAIANAARRLIWGDRLLPLYDSVARSRDRMIVDFHLDPSGNYVD